LKIILMGPPGSGKGTQASHIADLAGVHSVSSGDLFRDNLSRNTELGRLAKTFMEKGEYVPDDVTIDMVMNWIEEPKHSAGFVLDGFPRTLPQAKALDEKLLDIGGVDRVVFFDVPEDDLVQRLSGRMICSSCQTPFHKIFSPPREENSCDSCGEVLYQREDDKPAVVRNRLHVYIRETEPVVDYFEKAGNLRRIDASMGINEVRESLEDVVR